MPIISQFYGIKIYMYFDDHNPPHFHAQYQNDEISIEIKTHRVINGQLPKRALKLVLEWAEIHQAELLENWEATNNNEAVFRKIEPLN